ncbi:unnamed protein product, partial [Pylaiella littoralis]
LFRRRGLRWRDLGRNVRASAIRCLCASLSGFPAATGGLFFLGDTGAVIHAVSNDEHVYNRRAPRRGETLLMVGDGECLPVSCFGDLDLVLHCRYDVRVTLRNVAVV